MKKNDIIQLKIDGYGEGGEGVARHEGMAVFVPFAIKGEVVKAKIILQKKSFAIGKLEQILEPSSGRVSPKCDVFTRCGGCQLQHMDETTQSQFKKGKVKECMSRIAFLYNEPSETVLGAFAFRYRNKLQLPLTDNNGLVGGFFAPYSHRIIEIQDCEIQDETAIKILRVLKEYANENNIKGYTEVDHKGLLRHLVTRSSKGGILVTIVINGTTLPNSNALVAKLDGLKIPYGLYINENKEQTNVITGEKFTYIGGLKSIEASENGVKYTIVPQSFLQINEEIKEIIYKDVVDKAEITQNDVVVNAYSGAGLLTAYLAKASKHAYGIEIVSEATESANELARLNNLTDKMTNITGDCRLELKKLIPKLQKEREQNRIYNLNHMKNLEKTYGVSGHIASEKAVATVEHNASEKVEDESKSENANRSQSDKSDNGNQNHLQQCKGENAILENMKLMKTDVTGKIIFILDPPRKGVDAEILQELKSLKPDKIIYISCNPATLARDVGVLCGTLTVTANGIEKSQTNCNAKVSTTAASSVLSNGIEKSQTNCNANKKQCMENDEATALTTSSQADYSITTLIPYDMFPQTSHVETLVCLTRSNS